MNEEELANFVRHVHGPAGFAQKVVFGHKLEHYGDQIRAYIDQRASSFSDMAEGQRWKRKTLQTMSRFEGGVQGYGWDERRGAAYATTDFKSGRLSMSTSFSGTLVTVHRVKRILGYIIAIILIAIVLSLGWIVAKGLQSGYMTFENYTQQLRSFYAL
jgi:hypothetical protein